MDSKQLAAAAADIAAKYSFKYQSNQGTPDAFTFQVTVHEDDGAVYLHATCNAQITEKRAQAELLKVYTEVKAAVIASGAPAKLIKRRGFFVWRTTFGQNWQRYTDGFERGIRLVA
jgi:hypothetical protein